MKKLDRDSESENLFIYYLLWGVRALEDKQLGDIRTQDCPEGAGPGTGQSLRLKNA